MDQGFWSDFFAFRRLISASWIKAIYVIGAVFITLGLLGALIAAAGAERAGLGLVVAVVYFVALNVGWRLVCEFLILFFSMHEQLVTIAKASQRPDAGPPASPFRPARAQGAPAGGPNEAGGTTVPFGVVRDYDRWVGGDATALRDFLERLEQSFDVLPERIDGTFLRYRFKEAVGIPAFDELAKRRDR